MTSRGRVGSGHRNGSPIPGPARMSWSISIRAPASGATSPNRTDGAIAKTPAARRPGKRQGNAMTTQDFDIAVIGAGMAGATAAAFLSTGKRVALIEAEEVAGYHTTGRSAAIWI